MTSRVTRRDFLAQVGCIGGGVALASRLGPSAFANEKRPGWPVTVACRDVMLKPTGQRDCWAALQAIRAEGVEALVADDMTLPNLFHPTEKYTLAPAGIEPLARAAKAAGQRITAFCMSNQFEARPDFEIKRCTQAARTAQALGVPAIRIDVVPAKLSQSEFLKVAVSAIKRIIEATEPTGVGFAVENHSNTTNDPAFLTALFDGVGSKRFGLTLDTANFYWFGHPLSKVYSLYEQLAPRVLHTHCKDIHYPASEREKRRPMGWKYTEYASPLGEGDIDFARVANILRKAGYHNDLCIEDEFLATLSAAAATQRLAKQVELLKRVRAEAAGH
ncbi:MAG: sugar phosphate isomerase/epimerase [Planctomycetaceae bacterium]|nr:sugar phosphate isomerase/epimerase [Planctomycetaceae bacterium]